MTPTDIAHLRERLEGFTVDAVLERLGTAAWLALARNESVPGDIATEGDGTPLATFIRLFQLQLSVAQRHAQNAFGEAFEPMLAAGYLKRSGDEVRATIDIRPYGDEQHDWWVVCDLTPGMDGLTRPMRPDFVLGISEASSSLAQLAVHRPVGSALDLGTGCGVQALHLSTHAERVVATDVNPRALELTRFTAALNGIDIEVRSGSLYDPVATERFDQICTNPPFVVSPPRHERLVYRETEFDGDEVVRRVVTEAGGRLNPGGRCQVLASWQIMAGQPWDERLGGWAAESGLDAWIVQREQADLPLYVQMWLADAGLRGGAEYTRRYDEWLRWFDSRGVEAMGFGWINLHRSDRATPIIECEEYLGAVAGPVGPDVLARETARTALGRDTLAMAWRIAPGVRQVTRGAVGADDPSSIELWREFGLQRQRRLDTIEAGFVSACDGELTAGALLDALSELLHTPNLRETYRAAIDDLALEGFLTPAS